MSSSPIGPSERYVEAVRFAVEHHVETDGTASVRKGTTVPYVSHVLAVSAIVWESGGDEDQAIAGVLHDTLEDTDATAGDLAALFGEGVAALVVQCSDGLTDGKAADAPRDASTWRGRKLAYIDHLSHADPRAQLISAADKLHNATAIVTDAQADELDPARPSVWGRFNASPADTVWFYQSVLSALQPNLVDTIVWHRLKVTIDEMAALAPGSGSPTAR